VVVVIIIADPSKHKRGAGEHKMWCKWKWSKKKKVGKAFTSLQP
jgi:hypothetical protein